MEDYFLRLFFIPNFAIANQLERVSTNTQVRWLTLTHTIVLIRGLWDGFPWNKALYILTTSHKNLDNNERDYIEGTRRVGI